MIIKEKIRQKYNLIIHAFNKKTILKLIFRFKIAKIRERKKASLSILINNVKVKKLKLKKLAIIIRFFYYKLKKKKFKKFINKTLKLFKEFNLKKVKIKILLNL